MAKPAGSRRRLSLRLVSKWSVTFKLNGFLFDLPERTAVCPVDSRSRPLGRRDDKQNNPSGMVSRIDRAISPPSPARTRIRRLTNRRKIQTRAASRAAANKEIRNANEYELLASNCSLRLSNGEQVN